MWDGWNEGTLLEGYVFGPMRSHLELLVNGTILEIDGAT